MIVFEKWDPKEGTIRVEDDGAVPTPQRLLDLITVLNSESVNAAIERALDELADSEDDAE